MWPINAGQLRHRVAIQTREYQLGPVGRKATQWSTVETRWARVISLSQARVTEQDGERGRSVYRIVFRGALSFNLADTRFIFNNQVFVPERPEYDPVGIGAWTAVQCTLDEEATV